MWAPGQLPNSVLVAKHGGEGALRRVADVKGADDPVHAGGGHDGIVVLVPVVCQDLGRGGGRVGITRGEGDAGRRRVDGDGGYQVVLGRGWGAEVEDAKMRVRGDGGDEGGVGWAEGGAVGAVPYRQRLDGVVPCW